MAEGALQVMARHLEATGFNSALASVKLPSFNGARNANFKAFLEKLEDIFDLDPILEQNKLKVFKRCLTGEAKIFFNISCRARELGYDEVVAIFNNHFVPADFNLQLKISFYSQKQVGPLSRFV